MDRHKLRWNGWGWRTMGFDLGDRDERVWAWLRGELGCELAYRPAMPLADISMPEPGLAAGVLALLAGIVGPEQVKVDRYERAFHARGKSYADLVALRAGDLGTPPDAVIYPRTAEEVERVLALADGERIAVIPYGGGTSVVGGVASLRGPGHVGIITVDMSLMNRLIAVDRVSHTATLQAGMYGPDIEHCLQAHGFTLGHYPQSFELSTLGGWIAARGAGQLSSRYGKAEDWLVCARLATPRGPWHTAPYPASAAGPDLNQIIAGSEGTLGIITEATVRIRPVAEDSDYRGYLFRSFSGGLAAAREIAQDRVPVAMLRLSDVEETRFFGALSAARSPSPLHRIAEQVLAAFGYADQRCLLLVGLEGDKAGIKSALARTRAIARKHGAFPAGRGVGESWYEQRFQTPYLRDPLLDRGIAVETLETATTWATIPALHHDVLAALHEAIRANLPEGAARGTAMSHISHVYEDGASLYFTLVFPQQPGRELEQWGAIKRAATDAIVAGGGTISHHHGVGLDHAPWLAREKGPIGVELLAAIKGELDPHGTLNPGKLVANPGKLVAPRMRPGPDSDKDT